jgi:hypothetical protein
MHPDTDPSIRLKYKVKCKVLSMAKYMKRYLILAVQKDEDDEPSQEEIKSPRARLFRE